MSPDKIKTLFIINPILEKRGGRNISRLIDEHLDHERFESEILYSEYPGHSRELSRRNVRNYQLIVAGGGDGTINQVARSLAHSETILGILPMGSGKGLARSLRIPLDPGKAIEIINRFQIARIDTGMAGMHRFVNIAGIGFAAEVAHAYAGSKTRGFFPYALNIAKILPGYSPISAGIAIEDRDIPGRYFTSVSQTPPSGGTAPVSVPFQNPMTVHLKSASSGNSRRSFFPVSWPVYMPDRSTDQNTWRPSR